MRWIIPVLIVLVVALMFWAGWLYLRDSPDSSELILDKDAVRQDAQAAADEGQQVLDQAGREMQNIGEAVGNAASEKPEPADPSD